MLAITKTAENGKAVFALEGRLDTVTAPALEKEVRESLDGIHELIFDLAKLKYVSSAGLRVLLLSFKLLRGKGGMKIVNSNDIVREVFEVTGMSQILGIK